MDGVDLYAVKEILGHQDIHTTMRYAHLSPEYLQDAINHGSLFGTGSKTGSKDVTAGKPGEAERLQPLETYEENEWLGDQESNLGSQNQNLLSCP